MFPNVRNMVINGGNFAHTTRTSTAFKELQMVSAPSAMHDSSARFDPPKCHQNTRVAVLEYILGWIFGRNDPEVLILWLYGQAGTGKSAILQTIAERCAERQSILASFFFGRNDPSRNTFKPLIPTIACQIAIAIPEIRPHLEGIIEHDPFIFDKSIATQLQSLIIQPLKVLSTSGYFNNPEINPRLIIIDGLDECNDPKTQSMILQVIADALRTQKLPLIFLIASRPEQNIQLTFNSTSLAGLWKSLVLDDTYKPDDDIRTFLVDSFWEIRSTHPYHRHIPSDWPSASNIKYLIEKSSGQFIYASVVIKYVSVPHDRPPHRLDVVMGLCPARLEVPFAELDALFMHLLESCPNSMLVLRILGIVLTFDKQTTPIETLLSLQPGDVELALGPLSAIIDIRNDWVLLSHASFGDFLKDISRSGKFHVNTLTVVESIFSTCVAMLMNPELTIDNLDRFVDHFRGAIFGIDDTPLTDNIKENLMQLSLPHIWSIHEFEWNATRQPQKYWWPFMRMDLVTILLLAFDPNTTDEHPPFKDARVEDVHMIYHFHLSSIKPILTSELENYYYGSDLMYIVVLKSALTLISWDFFEDNCLSIGNRTESWKFIQQLLQLTDESIWIDNCRLRLAANFFFTRKTNNYIIHFWEPISGDEYAGTALKLLRRLCNYSTHRIRSRNYSAHQSPANSYPRKSINSKPLHSIHHPQYPRLRRAKRRQHGFELSIPSNNNSPCSPYKICYAGLQLLPGTLQQSSKCSELIEFIRSNGKKIPFIPNLTRKAISAMHDYLFYCGEF